MKLICLLLMLTMSAQISGQQIIGVENTSYLKKSKNQKTAAWVMLTGGAVTTTVGVGIALGGGLDCAFGSPDCGKNQTLTDILGYSGIAAVLGSVPLFIAASKNKKKGMSLSVGGQSAARIFKDNLTYKTVPSLTFIINL